MKKQVGSDVVCADVSGWIAVTLGTVGECGSCFVAVDHPTSRVYPKGHKGYRVASDGAPMGTKMHVCDDWSLNQAIYCHHFCGWMSNQDYHCASSPEENLASDLT